MSSESANAAMPPWDPSEPNAIDRLQVVYKIAERCNLNCSYCYYYNMGDDTALHRPPRASLQTSHRLARWLAGGCRELGIRNVHISFHGGEPMLVRAAEFAQACDTFLSTIEPAAKVHFSIQTNGTLLTEGWIEALKAYRVSVGISIDGNRADHDRYRIDHRGQSTFDATEAAITRLVAESQLLPSLRPGTISVVNHRIDYAETYQYLRSLGIRQMHFLLPDRNAENRSIRSETKAKAIGRGLLRLFEAWIAEDDVSVDIRFIREALGHFQIGAPVHAQPQERKSNQILVARSDNTVAIDDSLIPALAWYSATPEFPIGSMSLREVFRDPIFMVMENLAKELPDDCVGCRWTSICRGGDLDNRYSVANGFNNRSIYCEAYKTLYAGICNTLLQKGYPRSEIQRRFGDLEHA